MVSALIVILFMVGVAWALPTITPTNIAPTLNIETVTEMNSPVEIAAPPVLSEDESQCQSAWKKFLIDFDVFYESVSEVEKRRNIFCENWKKIQNHNVQFELGVESFKKGINQFSDLTFEEWKEKQKSIVEPEFTNVEDTTDKSKVDSIKCDVAWKIFLINFEAKYKDDAETDKRRIIFCENLRKIQDHNLQYELGVESFKKGINQFSDLTFEEWKAKQRPILNPEFSKETTSTEALEYEQDVNLKGRQTTQRTGLEAELSKGEQTTEVPREPLVIP
uniref:Uncharacterized protein LOC108044927 n=1 Tax=Drosophila rhopaloa TaxID=1041015 RepID=A0A6P4F2L5_DRORH